MKSAIRFLDRVLGRIQGLFVYWDDPRAMFRIQIAQAPHTLHLSDGDVEAGAPVLQLHFWNEHTPEFSRAGPDLAWAMGVYRMLRPSFRILARHLVENPDLAGVQALGGATILVGVGKDSSPEKLFRRLGLELFPYHSPLGRFGEFWENLYTWGLMWAYNGASLRHRHLLSLQRTEAWISTEAFLRRYSAKETESSREG
jgi:hypothetical protein